MHAILMALTSSGGAGGMAGLSQTASLGQAAGASGASMGSAAGSQATQMASATRPPLDPSQVPDLSKGSNPELKGGKTEASKGIDASKFLGEISKKTEQEQARGEANLKAAEQRLGR